MVRTGQYPGVPRPVQPSAACCARTKRAASASACWGLSRERFPGEKDASSGGNAKPYKTSAPPKETTRESEATTPRMSPKVSFGNSLKPSAQRRPGQRGQP